MQHFIYSISEERRVVQTEEYEKMLKTDEWFRTPKEAADALKERAKKVVANEKKATKKGDK